MGKDKGKNKAKENLNMKNLEKGIAIYNRNSLFRQIYTMLRMSDKEKLGKETAAVVYREGAIYVNKDYALEPEQWAYVIAHCQLHLCFGHFDADKVPEGEFDKRLWNMACDLFVTKFLKDMKFGKSLNGEDVEAFAGTLTDEVKIYQQLKEQGQTGQTQPFGTASFHSMDMIGLEKPIVYSKHEVNEFMSEFADALAYSACEAVSISGGHGKLDDHVETKAERAKQWFVNHYPLLGSLASMFKLLEDSQICMQEEISIAAIDIDGRKIFVNPAARLSSEEMKFVMAHELLHAGLSHQSRCQGRDHYLWNVACDFVINGWLMDMHVGEMPKQGLLYDKAYKDWSAEAIYEELIKEIKKNHKLNTFRGYHKGDILERRSGEKVDISRGMTLDEFCKSALAQGLDYHISHNRGLVPAGLVEEIRALAMPPLPWDMELANWFDCQFPPMEKNILTHAPVADRVRPQIFHGQAV